MNILLPLPPQMIDHIRLGRTKQVYISDFKKPYKYLKKCPDKIYVFFYSIDPINKLVGYTGISKLVATRPNEAWKYSSNYSGMTEEEFFNKFGECTNVYVLYLEEYIEFEQNIMVEKIYPKFTEPKNYIFLDILDTCKI